jgi:putative endonuclease
MFYVYILRCADQSLYVGQTCNINRRVETHNAERGAAFTSKRRPVKLVYAESHDTETAAVRRERQLKRWTREKKEALIRGDVDLLRALSKRRK